MILQVFADAGLVEHDWNAVLRRVVLPARRRRAAGVAVS